MATNVTVNTSYTTDNINNSDKTSSSSAVYSSSSAVGDTPERILEKLLTVDSDDSTLNANTLQGKTASEFATPASVAAAVAALVDSSPQALDTLNELAAAMGDDPNFAATVTNALATKQIKGEVIDVNNGNDINLNAAANSEDSGDIVFFNGSGVERHRIFDGWGYESGTLAYRANSGTAYKLHHSGNANLLTVDWNTQHLNIYGRTEINPTSASHSYTQYKINNVPYGLIGSDATIYGGSATNMGVYVYGNNDLELSTNGEKRLIVKGNGTVEINSNLKIVEPVNGYYWSLQNIPDDGDFLITNGVTESLKILRDGNIQLGGNLQGDTTFVSGFKGSGMKLSKDVNSKYNLELDNLTVRGGMSVYELTVNKVRATNGALYVSDSCKIKNCHIEPNNGNPYWKLYTEDTNTFQVGDVVKCQVYSDNGVKCYILKIDWVNSTSFSCPISKIIQGGTGANIPAIGDTLVRIASDVANRQGTIYLTSSDTNSPYIQVVDGATSANLAGDVKVRLGKLEGITSTYFGNLTGYGLYTNNAVLDNARVSGNISATSGNIGGFNIANSSLSTNYVDLNNTTKSIDLYNTNSNVNSGIRFYYGEKNATPLYIARLNAYRHADYGDIFSIFVNNILNFSANSVKMSGSLTVNDTTNTNYLYVNNNLTVIGSANMYDNLVVSGNLSVNGTSTINRPTYTLTYNTVGAWPSFSSILLNGRSEGKVNNLNLTFYSSNSSASWQKLGTITNYVSTGYDVYFTPTTGTVVGENSVGYIATTGEIFIMPGKGGQKYYGQVTWITP